MKPLVQLALAVIAVGAALSRRADPTITPEDVHAAADRAGVRWDNDPAFMAWTERLTGKRHLDAMTGRELRLVVHSLGARYAEGMQEGV